MLENPARRAFNLLMEEEYGRRLSNRAKRRYRKWLLRKLKLEAEKAPQPSSSAKLVEEIVPGREL